MKRFILSFIIVMIVIVLSACGMVTSQSDTAATDVFTPTLQVLESTPVPIIAKDTTQWFTSDQLGFCFSYPQGYTQLPNSDTVEIIGPELPSPDLRALFWLEISDAYDRTAEVIADQDMKIANLTSVGRSFVTLDGEPAVVLDGMPGQDFQRRVYVVQGQTLYVLAFMPTRSENQAASDQLEALYSAIMNSWAWSPCSATE